MTADEQGVLVTPKQIKEWEAQIAALQRKVVIGKELLHGIVGNTGTAKGEAHAAGVGADISFMGSVVRLANGEEPISRAEMRASLAKMGFDQDKISKQFNTVLYKTMKAERTSFLPNGKVWKGKK